MLGSSLIEEAKLPDRQVLPARTELQSYAGPDNQVEEGQIDSGTGAQNRTRGPTTNTPGSANEEARRARLHRERALSDALAAYSGVRSADTFPAELQTLEQIFNLPEIVYQAAFAPDFSEQGQLAG